MIRTHSTPFSITGFLRQTNQRLDQALVTELVRTRGISESEAKQVIEERTSTAVQGVKFV